MTCRGKQLLGACCGALLLVFVLGLATGHPGSGHAAEQAEHGGGHASDESEQPILAAPHGTTTGSRDVVMQHFSTPPSDQPTPDPASLTQSDAEAACGLASSEGAVCGTEAVELSQPGSSLDAAAMQLDQAPDASNASSTANCTSDSAAMPAQVADPAGTATTTATRTATVPVPAADSEGTATAGAERAGKRVPTMIPGLDEFTLQDAATLQPPAKDQGTGSTLPDLGTAGAGAWVVDEAGMLVSPTPASAGGFDPPELHLGAPGHTGAVPTVGAAGSVAGNPAPADEDELEEGRRINLADADAGATVIAVNKEAKYPDQAIDSDEDSYMKNFCAANKWMILELSQLGRVDAVVLTMKEMYSSRAREFVVKGRQTHPKRDGQPDYTKGFSSDAWQLIGNFTAANVKGTQTFNAPNRLRVRYVLFQFLTHYGSEEVCALNRLQVVGVSAAQELEAALSRQLGAAESALPQRPAAQAAPTPQGGGAAPLQDQPPGGPAQRNASAERAADAGAEPGLPPTASTAVQTDSPSQQPVPPVEGPCTGTKCAKPGVPTENATLSSDEAQGDNADTSHDTGAGEKLDQQGATQGHQPHDVRFSTTHVLSKLLPGKLLTRMGLSASEMCRNGGSCVHPDKSGGQAGEREDGCAKVGDATQDDGCARGGQGEVPAREAPVGEEPSVAASDLPPPTDPVAPQAPPESPSLSAPLGSEPAAPSGHSDEDRPSDADVPTSAGKEGTGAAQAPSPGKWHPPSQPQPDGKVEPQSGGSAGDAVVGVVPTPQVPVVVPLPVLPTTGMGPGDLESILLALSAGPSNRHKPAGNLFDVFKQEFMMLKLNQTRMAKYMSQVVELLNKNTADMLGEVQDLEERLAAAKAKAVQAQAKATEAADAMVAAAERRWAERLAATEATLAGRLGEVTGELQAVQAREAILWAICVSLGICVLVLARQSASWAPGQATSSQDLAKSHQHSLERVPSSTASSLAPVSPAPVSGARPAHTPNSGQAQQASGAGRDLAAKGKAKDSGSRAVSSGARHSSNGASDKRPAPPTPASLLERKPRIWVAKRTGLFLLLAFLLCLLAVAIATRPILFEGLWVALEGRGSVAGTL